MRASFDVHGLVGPTVAVLFEERSVAVNESVFEDSFECMDVHVYRLK